MSKIESNSWVVEYDVDYDTRMFTVTRVINVDGKEYPRHNRPHTFVIAADELGAFNAGTRVMRQLGLIPNESNA